MSFYTGYGSGGGGGGVRVEEYEDMSEDGIGGAVGCAVGEMRRW